MKERKRLSINKGKGGVDWMGEGGGTAFIAKQNRQNRKKKGVKVGVGSNSF